MSLSEAPPLSRVLIGTPSRRLLDHLAFLGKTELKEASQAPEGDEERSSSNINAIGDCFKWNTTRARFFGWND
jgi:hypothetical protein